MPGSADIAVIGLAARYPDAEDHHGLWRLVRTASTSRPVGDPHGFDAACFGLAEPEADELHPAVRLFLECCLTAAEDAGHDPSGFTGRVGVYGGSPVPDELAARVAYCLDTTGPALSVGSGESSSLAAVHVAAQALRTGDCDLALAGGAAGPPGGGAGVVVLRRLEDAAGDRVLAVIRGSAVGNDGGRRAGWAAADPLARSAAVAEAWRCAGVSAEDVDYFEPAALDLPEHVAAEAESLRRAFAGTRAGRVVVGGADATTRAAGHAAGIRSLLKLVLALAHREFPTTPESRPVAALPATGEPFTAVDRPGPWTAEPGRARIGCVGSAGVGGTSVHVVVQESPPPRPIPPAPEGPFVIPLSAATAPALGVLTSRLRTHLDTAADSALADIAHTLQVGRRPLPHRIAITASTTAQARDELGRATPVIVHGKARAVFLFPGLGVRHDGSGARLYRRAETYRHWVDRGLRALDPDLAHRVREVLMSDRPTTAGGDPLSLLRTRTTPEPTDTAVAQPALFIGEHALARQLMAWGVEPAAVVGHSLGEYVAACVAGAIDPEDAVRLVAERARLIADLPAGSMIAVPLGEEEAREHLRPGVDLAAVNGKGACVLAGEPAEVERIATALAARGIASRPLDVRHAFHSRTLAPVACDLHRVAAATRFSPAAIPLVSTVSGTWLTVAPDADHWVEHLCGTVRFHDGVGAVLADRDHVLVEVGHGTALSSFARQHTRMTRARLGRVVAMLPDDGRGDDPLPSGLAELWRCGVFVDWRRVHPDRVRVPLPTYPFDYRGWSRR
ncbi:acyltransferase domain-containing protein [Saccharothrix deserti]|uniref:acyltransferase domain-containing protein n=1 Tax=Saccharothrix deserti TaxID=2593674 RepID=UPI00131CAC84|nr:type I polyketide synthase [Saccharothrix deserti]